MSLGRIGEGQDHANPDSELSIVDEPGNLRQFLGRHLDQEEGGFDAMPLRETLIRLGDRRNQLAASTQDLERALLCFAANEIDHSVGTPDTVLEPPGPVVDDRVRAELANESRIVRRRGRNDMQTRLARELDGIGSDASGGAMNHDGLPCREPGVVEQGLPSRHGNDGHAGRFDVAERGGLARDHRRRRQGVLRIGSDELGVRHAIDLLSHERSRNPWPHGNDFTRQIRAQRQGQRLRQGTFPGPDPAVPWTYSRGLDLYEDLAWAGIGAGDSLELHDVRRSVLMHAPGHHRRQTGWDRAIDTRVAGGDRVRHGWSGSW